MIIIVFGLPGVGKSFFAKSLAQKLKAKYLNTDIIRNEKYEHFDYNEHNKTDVYKHLINEMYNYAHSKKDLVLDGTFYKKRIREAFLKLSNDLNIKLNWIEITADEDVVKGRLSEKREHSEADYNVYLKIKEDFEPINTHEYLSLKSTNFNMDDMIKKAIDFINDK
ncbi:AAA family ATPase [Marivirga arenosa]|uniref:AAA family ATPase n=1 Tax=Marivirga arenosa TaxID=3059076 RepID=A0AA49JCU7_9BACT|nr:AAA family ATPase [Marivirga sp. BKB1-2]WKK80635.2 AAA family ATPase [Marivirga sp. BKB1-2]